MRVVFIVGPTGSGKSDFALSLAVKENAEILNADSLQVYCGLDIGTAKPSLDERQQVPHHLFDIVDLGGAINAAGYRQLALDKLKELSDRSQKLAFVVGGSGFYIRALIEGMYRTPELSANEKEQLQNRFNQLITEQGSLAPHKELSLLDPDYAKKISPNDLYRLGRGLEIIWSTGKPVTKWQKDLEEEKKKQREQSFPYEYQILGIKIDRDILRQRVILRTEQMLTYGLIEEVEGLRKKGFSDWNPLQSVGYKEVVEMLEGNLVREELAEKIVTSTMQLAKKQVTWFKKQPGIDWLVHEGKHE